MPIAQPFYVIVTKTSKIKQINGIEHQGVQQDIAQDVVMIEHDGQD